jgi:hypothetical protein
MLNIPIVILNKDRLTPLKILVKNLQDRGHYNILIIDNQSTYQPLLDWYDTSNVEVFYNDIPETNFDSDTFRNLVDVVKHPKFIDLVKDYYVYTDSDIIIPDEVPTDFINQFVTLINKYEVTKVGMAIKIDYLNEELFPNWHLCDGRPAHHIISGITSETEWWYDKYKVADVDYELYKTPIDTTFAVYAPNTSPCWTDNAIRVADKFSCIHYPWYYGSVLMDIPEDELHYLNNTSQEKLEATTRNSFVLKKVIEDRFM